MAGRRAPAAPALALLGVRPFEDARRAPLFELSNSPLGPLGQVSLDAGIALDAARNAGGRLARLIALHGAALDAAEGVGALVRDGDPLGRAIGEALRDEVLT